MFKFTLFGLGRFQHFSGRIVTPYSSYRQPDFSGTSAFFKSLDGPQKSDMP